MNPHEASPRPTPARAAPARAASLAATLVVALFLAVAPAQSLPELLPADVAVAFGVRDLASQTERLQPFLDEVERLGLVDSLTGAVPDDAEEAEMPDLPAALADLEAMDLLGQEAWLAVSASPFQPIPAVTVIARVSDAALDGFRTVIDDAAGQPGVERLDEGGRTLWTFVPPADGSEDALQVPIAYASTDEGVLVASTDPETVRFVLRALSGSQDPTMADGDLYATLSGLGEGHSLFMADLLPLTRPLESLAAGFEAGPVLTRLQVALATAGPRVGLTRLTDDGLESRSLLLPDPNGPDGTLYALLTEGTAAGAEALAFAPDDAVMVASSTFDAGGWWAWLDEVLASAQPLGVPSATELAMMLGLDLQTMLFAWMGDGVVQVYPSVAVPVEPGMPQEALGATQAFLLETTDDAAARQGLDMLLSTIGPTLGAFTSPDGGGAMAMPETVQVAGQDVRRLTLMESFQVDAAVVDGFALLSFSPEVTEAVLGARAADDAPPAAFADVAAELGADLRAWSVSDDRAALLGARDALVSQLQALAGLGGASELDFEAVDEASADLGAFLEFVAGRMGTSRGATRVEDGAVRSEGFTTVDW